MHEPFTGFVNFIRKQGVMGLAVGFLLGGAVSKMVTAFVTDLINPLLSLALGAAANLREAKLAFYGVEILWGDFLSAMIDFIIIASVVYFGIKGLGLDKLDEKKDVSG